MKSSLMLGGHVRTVKQKELSSIRGTVSTPDTTIQTKMVTIVDTGTKEGRQKSKHSMRRTMTEALARTMEL
eukprot:5617393-Heterocapsa_arctica.AAC.1